MLQDLWDDRIQFLVMGWMDVVDVWGREGYSPVTIHREVGR